MNIFRTRIAAVTLTAALAVTASACGGGSSVTPAAAPSDVNPSGQITPRKISWLLSRPADGGVITTMKALADEYATDHPGFSLEFITTPDRPSYLQKYETLAAANRLPELFDTDATPFAKKLADQGRIMDAGALLDDLGLKDSYRPAALNYQRFPDGSLHMIPFEFQLEVFWYNKSLLAKAGAQVPASLDDFPAMCTKLRSSGVTPIALDGQDQWPLERYLAYYPFRTAGPEYVQKLARGEATFSDPVGRQAVEWMSALGKAGCFQKGFSSTGYADAQALFTSGKAAVYGIGTWELSNLATDELDATVRKDVDFFTLPVTADSVTEANEYVSPSGIGMAVNARTYDPLVRDFLAFALKQYPQAYAASGALSPTTDAATTVPANATPLYQRSLDMAGKVGEQSIVPWDAQLDPTTNTRLQQELTLLVLGDITADEFITTMDKTLEQNATASS